MLDCLFAMRLVLTGAPLTLPPFRAERPAFFPLREAPGCAVEESLLDVRFRHSQGEERSLDYAFQHPSQKSASDGRENRQTPLGLT